MGTIEKAAGDERALVRKMNRLYKLLLNTKFIVNFSVLQKHSKKYKVDRNKQNILHVRIYIVTHLFLH